MQRQGFFGGSAALRIRATGGVLLAAHLVVVAWLTLRPLDVPWVTPPNLHPFDGIRAEVALGWPQAVRCVGGGLGLLAPLGVLLPMVNGRTVVSAPASLLRSTAAGALLSLGIELLQTGVPGRVADIDSLLLNTAGVALAHLAVVPAGRAWLRRRSEAGRNGDLLQEEPSQGRTPTIPRVGIAP
ncbi:VanZ family protein [Streptomyces sp. NPDC090994]|uniref:VanZ family protein n=1 Tax=Streptomyces sp. NPDC090994 TaxID=3365969 RepID=UPI0037F83306